MEEQSLLQGRQGQHVLKQRIRALQSVDIRLRKLQQWEIARSMAASIRLADMLLEALQYVEPTPRKLGNVVLRQQPRRPRPRRNQGSALTVLDRARVHFHTVGKPQRALDAAEIFRFGSEADEQRPATAIGFAKAAKIREDVGVGLKLQLQ